MGESGMTGKCGPAPKALDKASVDEPCAFESIPDAFVSNPPPAKIGATGLVPPVALYPNTIHSGVPTDIVVPVIGVPVCPKTIRFNPAVAA